MPTQFCDGISPDQLLNLPLPETITHRLGSTDGVILGPDVPWFDHIQRVEGLQHLLHVLPELLGALESQCSSEVAHMRSLNLPDGISHCEECSQAAVLTSEVEWLEHLQQIDNLRTLLEALPGLLDELQTLSEEFGQAETSEQAMAIV